MTGYRGSGGPNGDRVWWPAGLEHASPSERVTALDRGYWFDGPDLVTRDGRRLSPVPTALSTDHSPQLDLERNGLQAIAAAACTGNERETTALR